MPDTAEVVQQYIELTNHPESPSFPLFADTLDWLEVHSGRNGGRQELFAAMQESRQAFDNVPLQVKSLIVQDNSAALEGVWSGRIIANGATVSVPMVYIFEVRDGKITKEIDYVILPS